jgi:hypothetical protein
MEPRFQVTFSPINRKEQSGGSNNQWKNQKKKKMAKVNTAPAAGTILAATFPAEWENRVMQDGWVGLQGEPYVVIVRAAQEAHPSSWPPCRRRGCACTALLQAQDRSGLLHKEQSKLQGVEENDCGGHGTALAGGSRLPVLRPCAAGVFQTMLAVGFAETMPTLATCTRPGWWTACRT